MTPVSKNKIRLANDIKALLFCFSRQRQASLSLNLLVIKKKTKKNPQDTRKENILGNKKLF